MKMKRKLSGKGLAEKSHRHRSMKKKVPVSFASLVKNAKLAIKHTRPDDIKSAIEFAVSSVKKNKRGKRVREPRTIKLPSIEGGILPLVPIFAGLSALGSIVGSTAGVANALNQARRGQLDLEESKRHNKKWNRLQLEIKLERDSIYINISMVKVFI